MSGPTPQSLSSIVDQVAPAPVEKAAPSPAASTTKPSLQSIIDSSPPVTPGQNVSTSKPPGEPPPADSHPQGQVSESQAKANLRELLVKRGLDVPEELDTDELIIDTLVNEFNTAATAFESPEYKAYLSWQEQQAAAAQKPAAAPVVQETPAGPEPHDLLNAVTQGVVSFDNTAKKWTSAHPQFANYADALNERDQRANQAKISFASDPEGFIAQKIKAAVAERSPAGEVSELKELLQQIRQERTEAAEQAKITTWENANLAKLYVPVTGEMTPYGQAYQEIESSIDKVNPKLSLMERHNQVIRQLAIVEKYLPKANPVETAPVAVVPKQSFLDAASRRNGINRLSEYTSPAANSVTPQIPTGKGGYPSLGGIINQQNSLTGN